MLSPSSMSCQHGGLLWPVCLSVCQSSHPSHPCLQCLSRHRAHSPPLSAVHRRVMSSVHGGQEDCRVVRRNRFLTHSQPIQAGGPDQVSILARQDEGDARPITDLRENWPRPELAPLRLAPLREPAWASHQLEWRF